MLIAALERCKIRTNSYLKLRISLSSEELFKPAGRLYSECCVDPLEQNLCFRNVSQEYGMCSDGIHYVTERVNRYYSKLKEKDLCLNKCRTYRICCSKPNLSFTEDFSELLILKYFKKLD